ncbi:T9SS type A sorting domain-containing protein [Polaribacter sp. Hel1_85]|uniref:T9SS type A sorting domain-containing protein n=1 Tax=Polaribacter sp. Hel1_85 TaxID=1250005 RepID=UPI00052BCCE5|nr:T9SS type A sorting domain-containing protein [Polaribacter sp. Hel1_85]KGL62074.1 endonuclease I [Polaribacter sp. Hel1_85]
MKKNYFFTLLLTLCFSVLSFGQDLLITGAFDGPNTGGTPKGIELYVANDIADLSIYGIGSANNGGGTDGEEFTFPSVAATAGTFIYVATEAPQFTAFFGFAPTYTDGSMGINGDDAVELFKNGSVVDTFGDIAKDGTGEAWDFVDGWAYRKDGTGPDDGFVLTNWTFSGTNQLEGGSTNAATNSPFPAGTYSAVASTTPEITATGDSESFDYFEGHGPSAEQSFTVMGTNLTADITVTIPTNFEISLTSGSGFGSSVMIPQTDGSASGIIYVRLSAGLSADTYTGDITASSAGATDLTGTFEGIVSPADPQFTVTAFLDDFNYVISAGLPSAEQTFNVEGLFLTADLIITAPTNFEVSLASGASFGSSVNVSPISGTITETMVYIRLKSGLTAGNYSGDIILSSTSVVDKSISVNGNAYGAPTNSMIITGAYDGNLSGGTPKGIELYVLKDIADLSLFGVSSVSNGGGSTAGNIEYYFEAGTAKAGTFIYISTEETNFTTFFGMAPTYTTGTVGINGDDSIELYENGQIIDVFGTVDCDPNNDGTTCPEWDYLDGWAYRKSNTGPEGTIFTHSNWTYSGANQLEGGTNNATSDVPFPIGTYTNTTASTIDNSIEGFATYPNPITDKRFTIITNSSDVKQISIFNVLGKKVLTTNFSGSKKSINVSTINSGIYILKVTESGKTATKKLVIR